MVHVHVHNDPERTVTAEKAPAGKSQRRTCAFTGPLFGWRSHYEPIVKRYAAKAEVEEKGRRRRSFLKRYGQLILMTSTLAALLGFSYLFL